MPAPIVSSYRDSEVSSFNISSQSLSEVSKTPQLSPKSVKSITVPMIENGNELGTSVGRTTSMVAARSSTVLQLSAGLHSIGYHEFRASCANANYA